MQRKRIPALTAAVLVGLGVSHAFASPEALVRVRGGARLEANATTNTAGTELSGTLRDDAGRPVADARLRVRWITRAGARLLPRPTACGGGTRPSPVGESDEALAETDAAGRFCLRWPLELPDGSLQVAYADERALLDSMTQTVELDRKPPVTLAFSPAPTTFSADGGAAMVTVEARGPGASSISPVPLTLSWVRVDKSTLTLAEAELRAGEPLRLTFAPSLLAQPGSGELVASIELGGRKLECRAQVALTARASLGSADEIAARSDGGAELSVNVTSAFGKVPSGSVEAMAHGRTIGIASVSDGHAELELHAPVEPGPVAVSLRYLSAAPWWLADDDRVITVVVARPSPWRWAPWAFGLLGIAAYLLAGWRRPPRRELPRREVAEPPQDRASIEWLAPARTGDGWVGRVTDAHDGAPIAGARVEVQLDGALVATVASDENGDFELSLRPSPETRTARIRIEATWHSPLEKPLPPPGKLAVSLLTRRRALLATLVEWAQRQGRPFASDREPTPGEVRGVADEAAQEGVAVWARRVEDAAFGANPVDADREAGVREHEPKR